MKASTFGIIAGALALIAGLIALIFPLPAGLAVTVFAGWAFVVAGALALWAVVGDRVAEGRILVILLGLIQVVLGVWLVENPFSGLVALTIVVGALLLISGILRLAIAPGLRGLPGFWPLIIAGAASLILGLYVLFAPQAASEVLLGMLLAIELLFIGAALMALGLAMRRR